MSRKADYGVGLRVLTDSALLRQIRAEIASNVMQLDQIAQLENVTTEQLLVLLRDRADEGGVCARLRSFANSRRGYRVVAWRTSRHHPSKLHLLDEEGTPLCGTPVGEREIWVDAGPCVTCASRAGIHVRHRAHESDRRLREYVQTKSNEAEGRRDSAANLAIGSILTHAEEGEQRRCTSQGMTA